MGFYLLFCVFFMCFFFPQLLFLFILGFLLYVVADTYGLMLIACASFVLLSWYISSSIFDPLIDKAKKQAKEKWDEYDAVKLWCNNPEDFYAQLNRQQPKMSAETKARIRRIQRQLKEQQKKRVANTLPLAKDYLSRKKTN